MYTSIYNNIMKMYITVLQMCLNQLDVNTSKFNTCIQ